MSALDRWLLAMVIWLGLIEEGADVRWPDFLYKLDDPRDRWTAPDKQLHGFGAWAAGAEVNSIVAGLCAVLVELVEVARWYSLTPTQRMLIEDGKLPWPFLCDRVSLKDLAWCAIGIVWHVLLTRIGM